MCLIGNCSCYSHNRNITDLSPTAPPAGKNFLVCWFRFVNTLKMKTKRTPHFASQLSQPFLQKETPLPINNYYQSYLIQAQLHHVGQMTATFVVSICWNDLHQSQHGTYFKELLLTEAAQKEFYFKLYKMHLYHQKTI